MTKKCLFTKSTENVNTSVIVQTELGPITVHICDDELGKTLSEVNAATSELIEQARNLADTFGFNLEEAIAKGGMMQIGTPALAAASAPSRATPAAQTVRMQEIPSRGQEVQEDPEEDLEEPSGVVEAVPVTPAPAPASEASIQEGVAPGEEIEKKVRVQSPHGRSFELPELMVDETGETSIAIDTESEKAFQQKMERDKKKYEAGELDSFQDGYTARFIPCKLCKDRRSGQPTGRVNGQPCPKCKGAGEIIVR